MQRLLRGARRRLLARSDRRGALAALGGGRRGALRARLSLADGADGAPAIAGADVDVLEVRACEPAFDLVAAIAILDRRGEAIELIVDDDAHRIVGVDA